MGNSDLQILRERIIRTGRDRDETDMIRKAVDAALDQLVLRQEEEELTDMKQIKEEIFLEIAKRLEVEKIKRQNTVEATTVSTTSTTATSSTSNPQNSPVQDATFYNFVADQGPQAVGVGLASLTYAAMASLPYWLPALAAGKRRRRKKRTLTNEIILPQDYQTTLYVQQQKYL